MIKNIFLPEKIGARYLFSKRIVGIDAGKTQINASQIKLQRDQIILEKFINILLENNNGAQHAERVGNALTVIRQGLDPHDALHTALSSSLIIVKELRVPFIGRDKISMIIDFEVEPLLPFSIHDAVVDFIVTQEFPEQNSSHVLAIAIQKVHLAQHLQLFEQIGLIPDVVTVDIIALYGLYKQLPSYAQSSETVALIDLGASSTRIAYLDKGQLRFIRSLQKGSSFLAKTMSEELNVQPHEAMETLIRFGLERYDAPKYTEATTKALTTFWHEIGFTLTSFASTDGQPLDRIILVGAGAEIKGLAHFVQTLLTIPCQLFPIEEVAQLPNVTSSTKNGISHANIISLSAALPSPITADFNLRKKEFAITTDIKEFDQSLIATALLILVIMGSLVSYSFFQTRKLKNEAYASEQEVLGQLQDTFPKALSDVSDLEDAIDQARVAVNQEEKLWFSFANPARTSFLTYLLELTSKIDKKSLGFVIDKLTISENAMTMVARVRNHEALNLLEQSLTTSKLFHIEKQQNPAFTMKIKLVKGSS